MRREVQNVQNKRKLLKMKPALKEWKSLQCRDNRQSYVSTYFAEKFMRCVTGVGYNFMKRNQKLNKQQVHRKKSEKGRLEKLIERHKKGCAIFWVYSHHIITAEDLLQFQDRPCGICDRQVLLVQSPLPVLSYFRHFE